MESYIFKITMSFRGRGTVEGGQRRIDRGAPAIGQAPHLLTELEIRTLPIIKRFGTLKDKILERYKESLLGPFKLSAAELKSLVDDDVLLNSQLGDDWKSKLGLDRVTPSQYFYFMQVWEKYSDDLPSISGAERIFLEKFLHNRAEMVFRNLLIKEKPIEIVV